MIETLELLDKLRKKYGVMIWEDWNQLNLSEKIEAICKSLESQVIGLQFRLSLYL
jgi:hypothetical protein